MAPLQQLRQQTSNCRLLLIYRPKKDERLSWPSWVTYSGWFTHISGHRSATGRSQDSKSTPAKDRCYTAGPRNQPSAESEIFRLVVPQLQQLGKCSFITYRKSIRRFPMGYRYSTYLSPKSPKGWLKNATSQFRSYEC